MTCHRPNFKPAEGISKSRSYLRKKKQQFYADQADKLPNELRGQMKEYNYKSCGGDLHIDENDYTWR